MQSNKQLKNVNMFEQNVGRIPNKQNHGNQF